MFLTAQGYLGISQDGFRVGDVVCIFSGGEVPSLLRPGGDARTPGGMFQLLSECYVHCVMEGEAMRKTQISRLQEIPIE